MTSALHSKDSADWYTPSPFVEAARELMGGIDLDPASDAEANHTVMADAYYTEADNGLDRPWAGRVFLNPPGGLVPNFWRTLMTEYRITRNVTEAIWIGYSLEQLQTLQGAAAETPLNFPICVPKRRIAFIENAAKRELRVAKLLAAGKKPNAKSQPSHANYIAYLGAPSKADEFKAIFSQFGTVRL